MMLNSSPLVAYASDSDDEAVELAVDQSVKFNDQAHLPPTNNKRKSTVDSTNTHPNTSVQDSNAQPSNSTDQSSNTNESIESAEPRQCSSCQSTTVLYRCPSCSVDSCSLACVNSHKAETGCSGKRPRSEFVPLSKFTDQTLTSDLFFLDEVRRLVDSSARNPLVGQASRAAASDPDAMAPSAFASTSTTPRFVSLQKACSSRGIRLLLMPDGMKRHQQNSSNVQGKAGIINWTIELKLHALNQSITVDRVNGDVDWITLLQTIKSKADERALSTDPEHSEDIAHSFNQSITDTAPRAVQHFSPPSHDSSAAANSNPDMIDANNTKENKLPQHKIRIRNIQQSITAPVRSWLDETVKSPDAWAIVMQVPMQSAQDQRYYLIDKTSPIISSMKDCTIVEYPTIIVVPQSELAAFPPALSREERALQQLQARKEKESKVAAVQPEPHSSAPSNSSLTEFSALSGVPPPPGIFKRWAV